MISYTNYIPRHFPKYQYIYTRASKNKFTISGKASLRRKWSVLAGWTCRARTDDAVYMRAICRQVDEMIAIIFATVGVADNINIDDSSQTGLQLGRHSRPDELQSATIPTKKPWLTIVNHGDQTNCGLATIFNSYSNSWSSSLWRPVRHLAAPCGVVCCKRQALHSAL